MMNWYFGGNNTFAWLTTAQGTKAERFYRKNGWIETESRIEIRFEMNVTEWFKRAR